MTTKTEVAPQRPTKVTHSDPPKSVTSSEKTPEGKSANMMYAAGIAVGAIACAAAYMLIRRK